MSLFKFLFVGELGTCPQNFMPTLGVEPRENHQFPQGGMLKFQTAKICQNLPKDENLIFHQKIKILVFFKNKNFYV